MTCHSGVRGLRRDNECIRTAYSAGVRAWELTFTVVKHTLVEHAGISPTMTAMASDALTRAVYVALNSPSLFPTPFAMNLIPRSRMKAPLPPIQ